jgi:hypothetical protein
LNQVVQLLLVLVQVTFKVLSVLKRKKQEEKENEIKATPLSWFDKHFGVRRDTPTVPSDAPKTPDAATPQANVGTTPAKPQDG